MKKTIIGIMCVFITFFYYLPINAQSYSGVEAFAESALTEYVNKDNYLKKIHSINIEYWAFDNQTKKYEIIFEGMWQDDGWVRDDVYTDTYILECDYNVCNATIRDKSSDYEKTNLKCLDIKVKDLQILEEERRIEEQLRIEEQRRIEEQLRIEEERRIEELNRQKEEQRKKDLAITTIRNRLLSDVHRCWRSTLDVEGWTYTPVSGGYVVCAYDNFNAITEILEGCDGCSWRMTLHYDSYGDLITCESITKEREMNSCK